MADFAEMELDQQIGYLVEVLSNPDQPEATLGVLSDELDYLQRVRRERGQAEGRLVEAAKAAEQENAKLQQQGRRAV